MNIKKKLFKMITLIIIGSIGLTIPAYASYETDNGLNMLPYETHLEEKRDNIVLYVFYDKQYLKEGETATLSFYRTCPYTYNNGIYEFIYDKTKYDIIDKIDKTHTKGIYEHRYTFEQTVYNETEEAVSETENKYSFIYNSIGGIYNSDSRASNLFDFKIKAKTDIDLSEILLPENFTHSFLNQRDSYNFKFNTVITNITNNNIENESKEALLPAPNSAGFYYGSFSDGIALHPTIEYKIGKLDIEPKYIRIKLKYDKTKFSLLWLQSNIYTLTEVKREGYENLNSNYYNTSSDGNIVERDGFWEIGQYYLTGASNFYKMTGYYDLSTISFVLNPTNPNCFFAENFIPVKDVLNCFEICLYDENWNEIEFKRTDVNTCSPIKNNITYFDEGDKTKIDIDYHENFYSNYAYTRFKFKNSEYSLDNIEVSPDIKLLKSFVETETIDGEEYTTITYVTFFTDATKGHLLSIYLNKHKKTDSYFTFKDFNFLFSAHLLWYSSDLFDYYDNSSQGKIYDITTINKICSPIKEENTDKNKEDEGLTINNENITINNENITINNENITTNNENITTNNENITTNNEDVLPTEENSGIDKVIETKDNGYKKIFFYSFTIALMGTIFIITRMKK